MYYRISRENYEAYLNLHMHLLAQCSECGFAETKPHIECHARKLREPRGIYSVRLQMIAHHCIYLRDGMKKRWESLGAHRLKLKSLRSLGSLGTDPDRSGANAGANPRPRCCSHCQSNFHPGNKKNCFWKDLSATEARKAAKVCAKNLGVGLIPDGED